VADSTSVNLFKVLGAALALRPGRTAIVSEAGNFPTDLYIAEGLSALLDRGHRLRTVAADQLATACDGDTAVLMLTHVNYRTGRMHDMTALTRAAHAAGALVVWDLAHSAGAVPLHLEAVKADFAVGCGYKFLNGGPGAPAFLYVAPRWQSEARFPIHGWFGHAEPFAFEPTFRPAVGIQAAAVGTPPILSLAALEVGVDLALEVPAEVLRRKALALSDQFIELLDHFGLTPELQLVTPVAHAERGSQVSLAHPGAYPIMQALISQGVIGDFRTPDILRFGITPMYLRHVDLWDAVSTLAGIMRSGSWRDPRYTQRSRVT
jgi:kynureninase